MEILGVVAQDIVGIVFLAGVVAAVVAVSTPDYTGLTRQVWNVPSDRNRLEIIAANPRAWRWSSAWWATGSVFNALGFALVAVMFRQAGESLLGEIAVLSFLLATALWLVAMAYRMGVEPHVMGATDSTTELPGWFKPVEAWSLYIMFIYMVLAYAAIGVLGWALLRTALLPDWIGWFSLIFGAAAALSMLFSIPRFPGTEYSIFGLPILLHLPPLIIGIALLVQG
jgi:hypothetical protein